jgi:hypothetical protein
VSQPLRTARDYARASLRDLTTHYLDLLGADVRARSGGQPVPVEHALARLAVSEAISRHVRDCRQVDVLSALNAGASWRDLGDVLDVPIEQLRGDFRQWVQGQQALYDALRKGRAGVPAIGMDAAHAEAAMQLAGVSDRERRCPLGHHRQP